MQLLIKLKLEPSVKKYFAFIPALIWAGIIVFMSLMPSKSIPSNFFIVTDKVIHSSIYLVLTLFLFLAFLYIERLLDENKPLFSSFIFSASISFVLGVVLEFAQENMDLGRTGDWKDVVANLFGIVIVYPLVIMIQKTGLIKYFLS